MIHNLIIYLKTGVIQITRMKSFFFIPGERPQINSHNLSLNHTDVQWQRREQQQDIFPWAGSREMEGMQDVETEHHMLLTEMLEVGYKVVCTPKLSFPGHS